MFFLLQILTFALTSKGSEEKFTGKSDHLKTIRTKKYYYAVLVFKPEYLTKKLTFLRTIHSGKVQHCTITSEKTTKISSKKVKKNIQK